MVPPPGSIRYLKPSAERRRNRRPAPARRQLTQSDLRGAGDHRHGGGDRGTAGRRRPDASRPPSDARSPRRRHLRSPKQRQPTRRPRSPTRPRPPRWRRLPRWRRRRAEASARREPDRPPPRTPVRGVRRPPRADRRPRRLGPGGQGGPLSAPRPRASRSRRGRPRLPRARSTTATGKELAVSEDAATVFATPYQVKDPEETAHKLAQDPRPRPGRRPAQPRRPQLRLRLHRAQGDLADAERIRKLDLPGIGMLPDSRRIYPQGELATQVIGTVGIDNQGLTGLEAADDEPLARHRRRARGGPRRARRRARAQHGRGRADRRRPEADARRQPPGRDRAACSPGSAQTYQPDGATAIVMDPRNSRDPRDGELAELRPGEARRCDPGRAPQHGDRVHLRAGLDLQGVHGRRGAPGAAGDAGDDVRPAARRSRSPTGRSTSRTSAAT